MYRSCVTDVKENAMICHTHEKFLGHDYLKRFSGGNTYCMWPSHKGKSRKCKTLRNPFPSKSNNEKKQSLFLYRNHSIILPFQSKICQDCSHDCRDKLKDFQEELVPSPELRRISLNLEENAVPNMSET